MGGGGGVGEWEEKIPDSEGHDSGLLQLMTGRFSLNIFNIPDSPIQEINKHFPSTYYVPGTVLGPGMRGS